MTSARHCDTLFKYRHFDREIIILCVRWYVSYKLSYRDLVEAMAERGIELAHTTAPLGAVLHAGIREALDAFFSPRREVLASG